MDRRKRLAAAVWLSLAAIAACRRAPAAGGECDAAAQPVGVCSGSTLLRCEVPTGSAAGVYRAYPCRGAKGCLQGACDTSMAEEGDACRMQDESGEPQVACSVARNSKLRCIDGRFVHLEHCRGPGGCDPASKRCDSSIGAVGDVCRAEGQSTCSADGKRVLYCRDGKEAKGEWCRGPGGCEMRDAGGGYSCDQRAGVVGEGCTSIGDSCSVDGRQVIWCERGRFSVRKDCGGKKCVSLTTTGDILRAQCE